MKLPIELKAAYKAYSKECTESNIEPVLDDFLAGNFPNWIKDQLNIDWLALQELQQQPLLADLQKAANELRLAEYGLYLAACRVEKIEPSLQDFEAGEIPDGVVSIMEREQNGEALAATA